MQMAVDLFSKLHFFHILGREEGLSDLVPELSTEKFPQCYKLLPTSPCCLTPAHSTAVVA